MSGSVWGELFRISTFGESHGKAVGVVVEGVSPNLSLCEEDVQKELDRRRPGQSDLTTPRKESDTVQIVSGVFDGRATGAPLAMLVWNGDQRPQAYDAIKDLFRPGHADYTFFKKYGIRDHRGGGRSSGRETIARVAAGAIAKKMLAEQGVVILAGTIQIGSVRTDKRDWSAVEKNPVRCPDADAAEKMAALIREAASQKDSVGGIVECRIQGVPAGLGEPVFDKLDADLAKAMLSLGAVKGIEFGAGFAAAEMRGSQHNDALVPGGFDTNNSGGITGGISNGDEIIFRIAVKPTASIATAQASLNTQGSPTTVVTEGRHDPCICPRIVPVVEAMAALTLVDHWKRQMAIGLGKF